MLVVVLFAVVLTLAYYYFTCNFSYWSKKGVNFIKPYPLVGSMGKVLTIREHMCEFFLRTYKQYRDEPFTGYFQGRIPALLIRDPELAKHVLIKDFTHFVDHGFVVDEEVDPMQAKNLFNMEGHRWKEMRSKLSPTFTSGRMKAMFPLVQECANILEQHMVKLVESGVDINVKDLLSRYTTDVISSCAFGVRCDSINEPSTHFRVMGRRMLEVDLIQGLKNITIFFAPEIARRLKFRFFDHEITEFFRGMVRDVIAMRKTTGESRNDFMQLLIQLKEKGRLAPEEGVEKENGHHVESAGAATLSDDDIAAQAMVFFLAGFETSSSALTFAFYELARRPELQQRARKQIEDVVRSHGGQLTYQALMDMTYLDGILQESLRKYPPVTVLNRVCTKNYQLPGTKINIEEGVLVGIPVHAMQNDPEFFPDPDNFDPERFDDEKQKNQFAFLPFGEGPRQCIGLRFARMQSKLGLVSMLRHFQLETCARTLTSLSWDTRQFVLMSKDDIILRARRVNNEQ